MHINMEILIQFNYTLETARLFLDSSIGDIKCIESINSLLLQTMSGIIAFRASNLNQKGAGHANGYAELLKTINSPTDEAR